MKILHVITTINRGGAENHLKDLIDGQIESGADVSCAYLKGDSYWSDYLKAAGCEVHPLNMDYYGHIAPVLRLRKLIKRLSPDIIHAHLPPAELYSRLALLGSFKKNPFIISKHNEAPFYRGYGAKVLSWWVSKRANKIIAISDSVKRYFIAERTITLEKIDVVHYGLSIAPYSEVTTNDVSELRSEWSGSNGEFLIGTVARLVPQKALHILIDGYAEYKKKSTKVSRLVIVGDGPLKKELDDHAIRAGIRTDLVWTGFREDIATVMSSFDLFALTSIYEGFGLVLLEAMAAKRAIVASDVSATSEIVEDSKTGLLVRALDPICLAKAFIDLENNDKRSDFGVRGYERVKLKFSIAPMVDKTMKVYESCLQ